HHVRVRVPIDLLEPPPAVVSQALQTQAAADAVASNDGVGVRNLRQALDLVLEPDIDSEAGRTPGQDVEQAAAADSQPRPDANVCSLACHAHHLARPCHSAPVYLASARRIVLVEVVEQVVPEHDAPAVGDTRRIPFEDSDVAGRAGKLHQDAEVEARRAT